MVSARKLRDAAIAVVLAIPTISMTRPVATQAMSPMAETSPIIANASFTAMTADEKRATIPID